MSDGEEEYDFAVGQVKYNLGRDLEILIVQDFMNALVGGLVCPGAIRLGYFVTSDKFEKDAFEKKCVLEVGAGCGLVGISTALMGAQTVISDLPEVVEHLSDNIEANHPVLGDKKENVTAFPVTWGEEEDVKQLMVHPLVSSSLTGGVEYVFAGDCFYIHPYIEPLFKTLEMIATDSTQIYSSGIPCPDPSIYSKSVLNMFLEVGPTYFDMYLVSLEHLDPYKEMRRAKGIKEDDEETQVPAERIEQAPSTENDLDVSGPCVLDTVCSDSNLKATHLARGIWLLKKKGSTDLPAFAKDALVVLK